MRKARRIGGPFSGRWILPCAWWAGCCRVVSDASPDSGSEVPAPTADTQGPLAHHERMMALPVDRQVDAWLATLRAEGYSSRQLEQRARILGQWAAGADSDGSPVIVAFQAWLDGD